MFTTIIELREFYGSPRGQAVATVLRPLLDRLAPPGSTAGGTTALLGYAPPAALQTTPQLVLMPAGQGVSAWPDSAPNRAALADETAWPLPDQSCDTVIIMHALEVCADPHAVLAEAWRVLKGQGRLVIVVPNRRGLWAHTEATPFGRGQPFTATQLRTALRAAQFVPQQWQRTLFTPPFKGRAALAALPLWEALGARLLPSFGGLLVMGAVKQLYAPTGRIPLKEKLNLMPPLLNPVNTRT